MRLFLYGTLLDPRVLAAHGGGPGARLAPATLAGWRRVRLRRSAAPTLRRDPGARVSGALLEAGAVAVGRLAAYEGPQYRMVRVRVQTEQGTQPAFAWVAPGGSRRPWPAQCPPPPLPGAARARKKVPPIASTSATPIRKKASA